jgi:hypothetical protein
MPDDASSAFYTNVRMQEWGMDKQPEPLQQSVRKVLNELTSEALLDLKDERLEVVVGPRERVWAYFPIHKNQPRYIVKRVGLTLKPATRILLMIGSDQFGDESREMFEGDLRHHLGHVMLYLFQPKASNECAAADEEWKSAAR